MKAGGRFTAWFSPTERAALDAMAAEEESTVNYIVRKAVRAYVGRERLKTGAEKVMDVAGNQS